MAYITKNGLRIQFQGKTITFGSSSNIPEVTIGTQTWMQYNVDVDLPNSKVYDDDENNRSLYGGLYLFNMKDDLESAYPGWRFPIRADFQTLIDYLGGETVAGGKLKESGYDYWNFPNTGADNSSGFSARGAGQFLEPMQWYEFLGEFAFYMCDYETNVDLLNVMVLSHTTEEVYIDDSYYAVDLNWLPVRLIKI